MNYKGLSIFLNFYLLSRFDTSTRPTSLLRFLWRYCYFFLISFANLSKAWKIWTFYYYFAYYFLFVLDMRRFFRYDFASQFRNVLNLVFNWLSTNSELWGWELDKELLVTLGVYRTGLAVFICYIFIMWVL